jgi:hypothetical protein
VLWNTGETDRVERPVGLRQLAPTLAEIGNAPHSFQANDLLGEERRNDRPWVKSKVFANGNRRAAVRTKSGKYIEELGRQELYDLSEDRDEQRNLVNERVETTDAFADALRSHIHTEEEFRAIARSAEAFLQEETL